MYEPLYEFLPIGALAIFLVAAVMAATGNDGEQQAGWRIPAAFSGLFLGWSLFALAQGGLGGVWVEHTRNAWGNQAGAVEASEVDRLRKHAVR